MEVNPNSPSNHSSVAPNALGNIQRPGEYLRQIRINQQRNLEDVAKELNIPVKTLTALEQDEYKSLPEATFIKGYYRTYAKFLGVDASSIIQRFDEIYTNDTGLLPNHALNNSPIKIMGKLPGSKRDRNRKWLRRIFITLVLFADQAESEPIHGPVQPICLPIDGLVCVAFAQGVTKDLSV